MDDSQYKIIVTGSGGNGQLLQGNGILDDHDEFVPVDFKSNFGSSCFIKKMKLNGMHGMMLTQDDRVFHWGEILDQISIPRQLSSIHGVISLSCGWQHALVLTHAGLFGFGSNRFSELGLPHPAYSEPHMIPVPHPIRKVYAGFRQSMLIMASGEVLGCGSSKFGELGSLTKVLKEFMLLSVPSNARQIKFGQKHTLLLTESGELYGWGDNTFGQLGQQQGLLCTDVKDFDTGWSHHVVLRSSSPYVMITGRGDFGQLGIGSQDHKYSYIPLDDILVQNKLGESIKVKCGAHSTYLIQQQGILVTGWNEHGNLGNGTKQNIYQFELMKQQMVIKLKPKGAYCFCIVL